MLKDTTDPDRIRFTPAEVEKAAVYGLDLTRVKSRETLVATEIALIKRLGTVKPEIVEMLVCEIAKGNPRYKLPARLSTVHGAS